MKRFIRICSILICICLLTAGCSTEQPVQPPDTPDNSQSGQTSPEPDAGEVFEEVDWEAELMMLRQAMVDTPQKIAIAYLGYYGGVADLQMKDWLATYCPIQSDNHPFLKSFDEDTVIGGEGDLYCLVAFDETADISLNRLNEDGEVAEILYKGDGKQALLFTANGAAFEPDTSVVLVDGKGESCEYRPMKNVYGRLMPDEAVTDCTCYEDVAGHGYYSALEMSWSKATGSQLQNTSWTAAKYGADGRELSYHLDFFEDTLHIQWKDGSEENSFKADWLVNDAGVLEMDLSNLDGERIFLVLISEEENLLQIFENFEEGDIAREYEALQTMFEKTVG